MNLWLTFATYVFVLTLPIAALIGSTWFALYPLQQRRRGNKIIRDGTRTTGVVVQSHTRQIAAAAPENDGTGHVERWRVEVIDFQIPSGQVIRAVPDIKDIGMIDRTGQTVTVFYDPAKPRQCVAPLNGRQMQTKPKVARILMAAMVFLFGVGMLWMGVDFLSGLP